MCNAVFPIDYFLMHLSGQFFPIRTSRLANNIHLFYWPFGIQKIFTCCRWFFSQQPAISLAQKIEKVLRRTCEK